MESEVLDCIDDLSYEGDIKDDDTLNAAVDGANGGPKNSAYTKLVAWASSELKVLCQLEEEVNPISSPDDHATFLMEVSAFLKELGCPYSTLTEGSTSQKLATKDTRLLLLTYLLTELEAARMVSSAQREKGVNGMKVEMVESGCAKDLKNLLVALGFPKPPNDITPKQLFTKVIEKVKGKAEGVNIGKPLFDGVLSDKQWNMLDQMQQELNAEYRMRRQMLIKRLDVTVQSFQWSERAKQRENDLTREFRSRRNVLLDDPAVTLGHLLSAREDLAVLEKTSCASVRKNTKSNLNKVLIGRVPDRGGRAHEHEPPPPEMPSWQKERQADGFSSGGGGSGGSNQGDNRGAPNNSNTESFNGNVDESQQRGGGGRGGGGRGGGGRGGYNQHDNRGGGGGYNQHDNRGGGGYNQHNKGNYNQGYNKDNRGGYNQHDNRGYNQHDNRGYNQYENRGYNQDNRGGGGGYNQNRGGYNQHDNRSYQGGGGRGGRGGGRGRY